MNSTTIEPRYLQIPTEPMTFIPLGMTQADFELVMTTIDLWKERIQSAPVITTTPAP